jgi:branched-chain amino acid aminotransferase
MRRAADAVSSSDWLPLPVESLAPIDRTTGCEHQSLAPGDRAAELRQFRARTMSAADATPDASLDGQLGRRDEFTISVTDEGFLRGDGAFEVARLYEGRPFALGDHLERLGRSAANLRLPADLERVRTEVEALLEAAGPGEGLLRLVLTRGGRRLLLIEPLPAAVDGVRLGYVTYSPTRVLDGIKSLSYAANMLATRLAQERGFDEALLITPHGRVLEAPTSTLFWVRGGALLTPPLDDHILASITRARLFEVAGASEAPCTADDLAAADEAFLASSVREVQYAAAIEDRDFDGEGPVTAEAARLLRDRIESELAAGDRG